MVPMVYNIAHAITTSYPTYTLSIYYVLCTMCYIPYTVYYTVLSHCTTLHYTTFHSPHYKTLYYTILVGNTTDWSGLHVTMLG